MSFNRKIFLLELAAWVVIGTLFFIVFALELGWQFALIRSAGMVAMFALIHYGNSFLFYRTVPKSRFAYYVFYLFLLIAFVSVLRYPLEAVVFPEQAHPKIFQGDFFRPVFYLLSTSLMTLLSTVVVYLTYLSQKEKQLLQRISAHNEARLQLLQSQIHPHFLFNALNNIYSLMLTNSAKAPDMLLKLTDLLRYSVYQKQREKVSVADEARQVEFLIELFCLRSDEPYSISFNKTISGGMIEPMVLIPLAENCLKHCNFDLDENAFVKMDLVSNERTIHFKTENSFNTSQVKTNTGGVGLSNIRERLELIYGDQFQFTTTEVDGIFKVNLEITWKK